MSYDYDAYSSYGTSSGPARYAQQMNKFWVVQKDIHRKVITAKIQEFLGPEATVRSYTKDGEDGYLVTTPGEFLTDDQIDDICNKSTQKWEEEALRRFGTLNGLLKRPLHRPVIIHRGTRQGAFAYGPVPGFAPPYMASSDYGPPPPSAPPAMSPFAPPPPHASDVRAARPGSSSGGGRRHHQHHTHHSRHGRSYSAGGPFAPPNAPPTGSSLRWEPSSMPEEGMDYE